jgi:hypothetical protein
VKIEAVMTDRALNYVVSEDFRDSLAAIEAQHI